MTKDNIYYNRKLPEKELGNIIFDYKGLSKRSLKITPLYRGSDYYSLKEEIIPYKNVVQGKIYFGEDRFIHIKQARGFINLFASFNPIERLYHLKIQNFGGKIIKQGQNIIEENLRTKLRISYHRRPIYCHNKNQYEGISEVIIMNDEELKTEKEEILIEHPIAGELKGHLFEIIDAKLETLSILFFELYKNSVDLWKIANEYTRMI